MSLSNSIDDESQIQTPNNIFTNSPLVQELSAFVQHSREHNSQSSSNGPAQPLSPETTTIMSVSASMMNESMGISQLLGVESPTELDSAQQEIDRVRRSVTQELDRLRSELETLRGNTDQITNRAMQSTGPTYEGAGSGGGGSDETIQDHIQQITNGVLEIVEPIYESVNGLSEETIQRCLRTRSCKQGSRDEVCAVCRDDLHREDETMIATLECGHEYHVSCIGRWLRRKNVCPLCRARALRLHP